MMSIPRQVAQVHLAPHPLAGESVWLCGKEMPATPVNVIDWWDRFWGDTWMWAEHVAAERYQAKVARREVPLDNEVVAASLGSLVVIVHAVELGEVVPRAVRWEREMELLSALWGWTPPELREAK